MEHQYYLPKTDTGQAIWLGTFAEALATYAAALGLSPAQLAAVEADADYFGEVTTLFARL
ncbi:MAG: hypothetical protein V4615_17745 [Bacteroidota bacterium]